MKKIFIYSLIGMFSLSCSVSVPDNSYPSPFTFHLSPLHDTSSSSPFTPHPSPEFTDLEKEYKSFSTKALSDAYVLRMFNKFLTTSPNPTQVIRQLEFARYLKDVKSDMSYFNSLKNFIGTDSAKFNLINNTSGVPGKKTSEPATFGTFVDSLNPVSLDSDVQTFIIAAGISDTNQQNAIKTLVSDLKTANIWTKMKAIYPFVGGTTSSHKWNLKDPRDLDVAFRLQFNGGWVHSATGAKPNGTDAYANTNLNLLNVFGNNNYAMGFYSRTNSDGLMADLGAGGDTAQMELLTKFGGTLYSDIPAYLSGRITVTNTNSTGFYTFSNDSVLGRYVFKNGNSIINSVYINVNLPDRTLILADWRDGNLVRPSNRENAFTFASTALTTNECANLYTIIQAYETTLGRQVN